MSLPPKYYTMAEASAYLRMPNARALVTFRYRHGTPRGIKQGRRLLFTQESLDEAMASLRERTASVRIDP